MTVKNPGDDILPRAKFDARFKTTISGKEAEFPEIDMDFIITRIKVKDLAL